MLSYKEQIRNKLNINTNLKNDCPSISYLKAAAFRMLFKQQVGDRGIVDTVLCE